MSGKLGGGEGFWEERPDHEWHRGAMLLLDRDPQDACLGVSFIVGLILDVERITVCLCVCVCVRECVCARAGVYTYAHHACIRMDVYALIGKQRKKRPGNRFGVSAADWRVQASRPLSEILQSQCPSILTM